MVRKGNESNMTNELTKGKIESWDNFLDYSFLQKNSTEMIRKKLVKDVHVAMEGHEKERLQTIKECQCKIVAPGFKSLCNHCKKLKIKWFSGVVGE